MRFFASFILIAIFISIISFTFFLYSNSYDSFVNSILDQIHRPDIYEKVTSIYFTKAKFLQLRLISFVGAVACLLGILILFFYRIKYLNLVDQIAHSVESYLAKSKHIIQSFSKEGKWILLVLFISIFVRSVYYANTFFIQYDEAWNYNLFLDQGIFYSIGAYNNYPLHNIISWLFVHGFGNTVFVLRLPSILFGLATVFVLVISIKYFLKSEWMAICIPLLFSCLPVSVFYMMYARGVILEIFFSIIIISLFFYYFKKGFTYQRIIILSIFNALATYSMLSHPYFILATSLGFFIYAISISKDLILKSIVYGGLSCLLSYLLLVPMQLGTGLTPGLSASYGFSLPSFNDYLHHIELYSSFITGFSLLFYLFFLISIILLVQNLRKKNIVYFLSLMNLGLLLLMVLIPLFTKIFPPERAFGFLILVPISMLSLLYFKIKDMKFGKILFIGLTIIFAFIFSYKSQTHHFLNWSKKLDQQVNELFTILNSNNINTIYGECVDAYYFAPGLDFYFKQIGKTFVYVSSSKQSTRYAASPNSTIRCIMVCKDKISKLPITTKVIYETKEIVVYKKMN